jgi:hypothetical protein
MGTCLVTAPCEGTERYTVIAESEADALERFCEDGEFERFDFVTFTDKPTAEEID